MGIIADIEAGISSAEVTHALDELAHEVADYAKSIAPVFGDRPPKRAEPGIGSPDDYKDSIKVTGRGPSKRRVESDDPKAVWIELGTEHMPEYAVFAKTAAHFGGTGPTLEQGVAHAQSRLRGELQKLADLNDAGASDAEVAEQRRNVAQARTYRRSAFKAARSGGPRRRGR
ncbi:hypothetical protein E2F47_22250 [Mycobacterium eburneum]|nr:hypothetical protein [Mycobacterium eburneum]TDH48890.1 hypothetical protein E2F47_22250 [Mycobacterium eburneum]